MGIVGFVINSPLGKSHDKKAIHLVNLLMNRKKTLEQLRPMPENEKAKFWTMKHLFLINLYFIIICYQLFQFNVQA